MLNENLGRVEVVDGVAHLRAPKGAAGHALYGPYEFFAPGDYEVAFEVTVAHPELSSRTSGEIFAIADVSTDSGNVALARKEFTFADIASASSRLSLRFRLIDTVKLELRLFVTGVVESLVSQRRTVARHSPFNLPDGDARERYLAREFAELVAFRGDDSDALYRAFVGSETPFQSPPQPVPFSSTPCRQTHFALDQYRYWCRQMKQRPRFTRKQWEFVYIAQALYERGVLGSGRAGLGFGCGTEPLPALFASFGVKVLATDQDEENAVETGWSQSGQHTYDLSALNGLGLCTDRMFQELVSFRNADMNAIPDDLRGFDFCWSSCALEHLGDLEKGLEFVRRSLETLKPGGVAVHTTELNLTSNEETISEGSVVLYRRRDIESFLGGLDPARFRALPVDWEEGTGFAELVVDLPPFGRGEPHIRLKHGDYDTTSIGLIVEKLA